MTINKLTIKLFGKKETVFRALDASGEVVKVFESKAGADTWLAAQ